MDFPFSDDFKKEVIKYNLKYRCVDCIHFDDNGIKCSFEYPIEDHHSYFFIMKHPKESTSGPRFTFCKYFEIT